MKIVNKLPKQHPKVLRDVEPGQVFSFESGRTVLLMTAVTKYVRLEDGVLVDCDSRLLDRQVKLYEHELVLKAVK